MANRDKRKDNKVPVRLEAFLFLACAAVLVILSVLGIEKDSAAADGKSTSENRTADAVPENESVRLASTFHAGWPEVDRSRVRFGVVQDVAEAFADGVYSGLVFVETTDERRVLDSWRERLAALPGKENKAPQLFLDGTDRDGNLKYRVALQEKDVGWVTVARDVDRWNIIRVEKRQTETDVVARERLAREARSLAAEREAERERLERAREEDYEYYEDYEDYEDY